MTWIDMIKDANVLAGFLITLFGVASGVVYWIYARMREAARSASSELSVSQQATARQVRALDKDVKDLDAKVDSVAAQVQGVDRRLTGMERTVESLPSRQDLHAVVLTVTRMEEQIAGLRGTSTRNEAILARLEQYLIDRSKP